MGRSAVGQADLLISRPGRHRRRCRTYLVGLTDEGRARFNELRETRGVGPRGRLTALEPAGIVELARLPRRLNADAVT